MDDLENLLSLLQTYGVKHYSDGTLTLDLEIGPGEVEEDDQFEISMEELKVITNN